MAENRQAFETYYKAQTLAYWSFIGFLVPIAGIILGALSKSRLEYIVANTEDDQYRLSHVRRLANWGQGISIFLLVLTIIGAICWGILVGWAVNETASQTTATPPWQTDSPVQ